MFSLLLQTITTTAEQKKWILEKQKSIDLYITIVSRRQILKLSLWCQLLENNSNFKWTYKTNTERTIE